MIVGGSFVKQQQNKKDKWQIKITAGDGAIKTIFHEVRKKSEIALLLLWLVLWLVQKNSCHSLNQSDTTPKPITNWSPTFSRALGGLVIFSSYWHSTHELSLKVLISNSPYCLLCNSYDLSWVNSVLDQLKLPWLIFFTILIICLLDIVLIL